jgi:hypothetical protein
MSIINQKIYRNKLFSQNYYKFFANYYRFFANYYRFFAKTAIDKICLTIYMV